MAPFRKFRIVERWVNYLPKNKLFQNRKFYTSDELFKLFNKDMGNLTTSMGFVKMIMTFMNSLISDYKYCTLIPNITF